MKEELKQLIHQAFLNKEMNSRVEEAVDLAIKQLDQGKIRVCEKETKTNEWKTNEWVKSALLLFFKTSKMRSFYAGSFSYRDKIPVKTWTLTDEVRVVPQALVRYGSYVAKNTVLMPSYINIGSYVDEASLIDTWATVGSCAQVGKQVHVSGGVGLGGVLEPIQAQPVIIEDHVFLGSRVIVVEGVRVCEGAVIGAGVVLTNSTRILDVTKSPAKEYKAYVPKNSVVIPGARAKKFPAGEFSVPCALIIGQRSEQTDKKTSLNDCLRELNVPV